MENNTKLTVAKVIIGHDLGTAKNLPEFEAAKSGSHADALRVAQSLITDEFVARIAAICEGKNPILQPVYSIEASGKNLIPHACALLLSQKLNIDVGFDIFQSSIPKRTAMGGLERIFNRPEFDGNVQSGRQYILLDDTITQGGTFASLESHITKSGGEILSAIALTGKEYSATLATTDETLKKLRGKHGDIEHRFQEQTGRSFAELTESEARYLAGYKPALAVRERIIQGGDPERRRDNEIADVKSEERVSSAPPVSAASAPTAQTVAALGTRLGALLKIDYSANPKTKHQPK